MINKEEFERFVEVMWKRLVEGQKKYGEEYRNSDIVEAMLEEATDLANYSFLLFIKAKNFGNKFRK